METTERQSRGFATISTPDGRHRIWLPRPTEAGRIFASCSFALAGHMDFVDGIDRLGYVRVERAETSDDNYSRLDLSCQDGPALCLERLMEDLPRLMEKHLSPKRRNFSISSPLLEALAAEVEREHLPVSIRRGTPYTDENGTETEDVVVELHDADFDFNAVLGRVVDRYIHQG